MIKRINKRVVTEAKDKDSIRDVIAEYFDYSFNFGFIDVVEDIVERALDIDCEDVYECVLGAIDEGLIYSEDMWTIAKFYNGSPADLDWDVTEGEFINDVGNIVEKINSGIEIEEDVKKPVKKGKKTLIPHL